MKVVQTEPKFCAANEAQVSLESHILSQRIPSYSCSLLSLEDRRNFASE